MKIVECPRDAMQGMAQFIPTEQKVAYLNSLLQVGFDTLDCGSFVSSKAIPQMRDTAEVFAQLEPSQSTQILAIVANVRGAREACQFSAVNYVGYPLSVSETFQRRNTNRSLAAALNDLMEIHNICRQTGKELAVYLSMGFGNPYGEPYHTDKVLERLHTLNMWSVRTISLADTVGVATSIDIHTLIEAAVREYPHMDLGAHLHSAPNSAAAKVDAAYAAGCRRLEGTMGGWGGCPMAKDELVGNIPTEEILRCLAQHDDPAMRRINAKALIRTHRMAKDIFSGGSAKRPGR